MGLLTITSEAIKLGEPVFLPLNVTFTGSATNVKQNVRITDGITPTSGNVQNYSLPPGLTIIQTVFWNDQFYTNPPDEFIINSIGLFLGVGATGTLVFTEEDAVTTVTTPVTIPINTGSPTVQYYVGIDGYNNGDVATRIIMNVTLRDSVSGDSYTDDVIIEFANEPSTLNVISDTSDGCSSTKVVEVVVPVGTQKHVKTVRTSIAATPLVDEIITTTTQYNLNIIGDNSGTSNTDTITLYVRDGNATGTIENTTSLTRQHNGNIC